MKIILFANTDWYLYNFRLPLARKIADRGNTVVLVSPEGQYGPKLKSEGFRWIPIYMARRSINPFSEIRSIYTLTKLYKKERPDLVHHFTIKCVIYGSIAARLTGVHGIVNAVAGLGHVYVSNQLSAKLLKRLVAFLMRISINSPCCRLILQNPDDYNFFLNNGLVSNDKMKIIRGSGVNTHKFRPRHPIKNRERIKVLMATRMLWKKGVKEFIDAAKLLKSSGRHIDLILAGAPDNGNPASVPHSYLIKCGKNKVIEYLGHVEKMEKLMNEVDVVVLPTTYGEGVPRILLEAASSGLPIIATNVPGCREIVEHQKNGLLIKTKDVNALAEAIQYLAERPHERSRMGAEGRKKVLKEFDEEIVIKKTLDVYEELLQGI